MNDCCIPSVPRVGPVLPFNVFMTATPTLPALYWNAESQEQRIKNICCRIQCLIDYADMLGVNINKNRVDIDQLIADFEKFKETGFFDYYAAQIEQWINDNMERIISAAIKMVFFGLTDDGYFCVYIPKSWAGITFDTVADYANENYGCLVLRY